jgi:hypothetical protein
MQLTSREGEGWLAGTGRQDWWWLGVQRQQ